jgi:hypothetical protein
MGVDEGSQESRDTKPAEAMNGGYAQYAVHW